MEKFTKPKPGKVRRSEMRSFAAGICDEIVPMVVIQFDDGLTPEESVAMINAGIRPALEAGSGLDPAERRAGLRRAAAILLALVALDERVRGEEVITREAEQTDVRGFFRKRSG